MQEEESRVRVMSTGEKNGYQGLTVNEAGGSDSESTHEDYGSRQYGFRAGASNSRFGKVYTFGSSSSSWLTRMAIVIILAALLTFFLFVALPVALIGAAVGGIIYIVLHLLQKR
ncbi:hypothetical protein TAMA11512_11200 [Selenomonas sp. TAMA-11512]|uniref:hypothetical protein n=1 Tax=Selenomonas sp. TAMA-11512 TaxID=3095337 RepID=UPI0030867C53|nr:hypothetical protein TAMA11512_11200 [Selenomonas sp. TAMA-11512]